LFNSIAILLGIGMLSEPLAFAYAGWIGGTFLVVSYGLVTCYTSVPSLGATGIMLTRRRAKVLGRIILADPSLRSYADIGQKAFGPRAVPFISGLFCLELFAVRWVSRLCPLQRQMLKEVTFTAWRW
jgi:vesicular inhibitory amino acid transporter